MVAHLEEQAKGPWDYPSLEGGALHPLWTSGVPLLWAFARREQPLLAFPVSSAVFHVVFIFLLGRLNDAPYLSQGG